MKTNIGSKRAARRIETSDTIIAGSGQALITATASELATMDREIEVAWMRGLITGLTMAGGAQLYNPKTRAAGQDLILSALVAEVAAGLNQD